MTFISMFYIEMPIFDAIKTDDRVAVKNLIAQGCNLKWLTNENDETSSPILYAAEIGRLEVLRLMLESKTRFSKDLLTDAMIKSCLEGHLDAVDLFIEKGAQINSTSADSHTPLTAAVQGNHLTIVKLLVEAGAKFDLTNTNGIYPLSMAAVFGYQEIFDYLEPLTLSVSKRKRAKKELLAKLAEHNL
jgi:uncharacterized protein